MKKKLSLIVLACALTLGVSGCGSEADTTTSNEKESMVGLFRGDCQQLQSDTG